MVCPQITGELTFFGGVVFVDKRRRRGNEARCHGWPCLAAWVMAIIGARAPCAKCPIISIISPKPKCVSINVSRIIIASAIAHAAYHQAAARETGRRGHWPAAAQWRRLSSRGGKKPIEVDPARRAPGAAA